jgi:hypothetical protein
MYTTLHYTYSVRESLSDEVFRSIIHRSTAIVHIDQVFTDQNQLTRTRLGLGIREYEYLHCTRSTILQVPGHWNPSPMRCTTVAGQMTPTPTPTRWQAEAAGGVTVAAASSGDGSRHRGKREERAVQHGGWAMREMEWWRRRRRAALAQSLPCPHPTPARWRIWAWLRPFEGGGEQKQHAHGARRTGTWGLGEWSRRRLGVGHGQSQRRGLKAE